MENPVQAVVTQDERTLATLAHVLQLVAWWIAPLIIYLVKRDSKFVSFHALQALLLQAAYVVLWIVLMVVWFATFLGMMSSRHGLPPSTQPPVAWFVLMAIFMLLTMGGWVTLVVTGIVYGIKAGRGEWARYPLLGNWAARMLRLDFPA